MNLDHGLMQWTGKLDVEEYALFQCGQCGRMVGLKPGEPPKSVEIGHLAAQHQAWILPSMAGLWEMEVPEGAETITTAVIDAQIVEKQSNDRSPIH